MKKLGWSWKGRLADGRMVFCNEEGYGVERDHGYLTCPTPEEQEEINNFEEEKEEEEGRHGTASI